MLKSTVISVLLHNKKNDEDTEIKMKLDDRVDLTFFSHVNSEQAKMDNKSKAIFFVLRIRWAKVRYIVGSWES